MISSGSFNQDMRQSTRYTTNLIGLLRHGKTQWNVKKKIQGFSDSPLTQEGKIGVKLWAETLKAVHWHRILASDLGRSRQTVSILVEELHLTVSFDPRLREQNWGAWEGKTLEELRSEFPRELQQQIDAGWSFRAPDGESRLEVLYRAQKALLEATTTWPKENILVVSHQGVISCLLYHLAGRKFLPTEEKLIHKDRFHTLTFTKGEFNLDSLNIRR